MIKISIVDNSFSHYGKCVLELKTRELKNSRSFILRNNKYILSVIKAANLPIMFVYYCQVPFFLSVMK